jgi:hypothetical protein
LGEVEDEMTDDELFHEFTRRVQDAVYGDLHVVGDHQRSVHDHLG